MVGGAKRMSPDGELASELAAAGYPRAVLPNWFGENATPPDEDDTPPAGIGAPPAESGVPPAGSGETVFTPAQSLPIGQGIPSVRQPASPQHPPSPQRTPGGAPPGVNGAPITPPPQQAGGISAEQQQQLAQRGINFARAERESCFHLSANPTMGISSTRG
jgi:hypothetical protein